MPVCGRYHSLSPNTPLPCPALFIDHASAMIEPLTTVAQMRKLTNRLRDNTGGSIGVVPTMGALHEGHLSLVRRSLESCDHTIVTIFVNPTQFAHDEDLEKYPRTMEQDLQMLEQAGVQHVFAPAASELYPDGFSTSIEAPKVALPLEGEFRPEHFAGVATIVLKLLNVTDADIAFFGQKDFQQACVIKAMVADLNVNTRIEVCPIVRESDGLALSSRNRYLSDDERQRALTLSRTLEHVRTLVMDEGLRDGFEIVTEMRQMLIDGGVDSVDYATIADPVTLQTLEQVELPAVALIAAHVGATRLIDNLLLEAK